MRSSSESPVLATPGSGFEGSTGALIIRIRSWGILYFFHHKEPPKTSIGNVLWYTIQFLIISNPPKLAEVILKAPTVTGFLLD